MNNKSRRLSLVAGVLALGLIGSACGSSSSSDTAAATAAPAATSATTAAAATTAEAATTAAAATTEAAPAATDAAAVKGTIAIDGSSTVGPLVALGAEDFMKDNSGLDITVGTSGTGGGFEKFCNGETDISDASRPIKDEEKAKCVAKGIAFTEMLIANDAISIAVNKDNDWATCLTTAQLKTMWGPEAEGKITNWNQIDPAFPDQKLSLFGPGTASGTFDYFTGAINGKGGQSRTDYSPSEDDNVTITGIEGDKGALGYFGLSYLEENGDNLKSVAVDSGAGCVAPSVATAQDGTYKPLSRPLFVYVKNESGAKAEVKAFVDYLVAQQDALTKEALFVPLTTDQRKTQAASLATVDAL